jgi:hypothetical protein
MFLTAGVNKQTSQYIPNLAQLTRRENDINFYICEKAIFTTTVFISNKRFLYLTI